MASTKLGMRLTATTAPELFKIGLLLILGIILLLLSGEHYRSLNIIFKGTGHGKT